jgi:hypothetical protein
MRFDNDIFVSYAHVDNEPFDNPQGWVDRFDQKLRLRVAQLLGSPPAVWRDTRLQGNEYFAGSIGDGISSTRLMLSVVSPRYVNSAWCRGEVREFSRRALQAGGGNLSRVFKVVKTHVDEGEMPEELKGLLGYHFYDFDERGRPREFRQDDPPNKDQRYWDRLEDLALDIVKALRTLKEESGEARREEESEQAEDESLPLEKKIYLAETTSDVQPERDRIRRELQQRGYYVLPDRELPLDAAGFEASAREALARCRLSVHLVGARYGLVPEGEEERSVVRWQEELAAERAAKDPSFARLIWLPPGLEPQGSRHRAFVEELQTHLGVGAELLQTSVEDLKLRVLEKLKPKQKTTQSEEADGVKQVYLICDNRDVDDVKPVEDFLFNEGFDTKNSVLDTEGADVAQAHREYMVRCDAALIYYGNANPMWLSTKIDDLKKAREWGRAAPFDARAVYVSAPQTPQKQRFRTHEVPVLQNFEAFRPEALAPFVNALRAGNGGRA